jgi:hypothetical protein
MSIFGGTIFVAVSDAGTDVVVDVGVVGAWGMGDGEVLAHDVIAKTKTIKQVTSQAVLLFILI